MISPCTEAASEAVSRVGKEEAAVDQVSKLRAEWAGELNL